MIPVDQYLNQPPPPKLLLAVDDNRDPQLDNVHGVRNFGTLNPKGDVFINPSPHGSETYVNRLEKPEMTEDSMETVPRHNRTDTHMNSGIAENMHRTLIHI